MSEPRASYRVTYQDLSAVSGALRREVERLASTESGPYHGPEPGLVRALMAHQEWSQTHVAGLLRVNVSTVRRWCAERGQPQSVEIPFAAWWLLLEHAGFASIDDLDGSSAATNQRKPPRTTSASSETSRSS